MQSGGDMIDPVQFITNKDGEKTAVVISIEEYAKLQEQVEELDEIRAFDEAESAGEVPVPFERSTKRERSTEMRPFDENHSAK
jgi:hypothetical protein